ncbi:hypothetical protein EVAR_56930_1 [Eumeta japonica]|uniref:Uncharacterized protein n=1 Tax=Eumeta variegata TaxID=151549 RepID=A0A4C1YF69_EUMVA|nr:hypothetical protein EVAR_56930_1 [Eumeta japonica]
MLHAQKSGTHQFDPALNQCTAMRAAVAARAESHVSTETAHLHWNCGPTENGLSDVALLCGQTGTGIQRAAGIRITVGNVIRSPLKMEELITRCGSRPTGCDSVQAARPPPFTLP